MRLAIVGKGGAGKSAICGTLARTLARRGHRVLALDVDRLPGLALSLGLAPGAVDDAGLPEELAERPLERGWILREGAASARSPCWPTGSATREGWRSCARRSRGRRSW